MHRAMVCFVLRVEAEDIGIVLHNKKKRAVIFIALAHIAPANRSSKFKELYIRTEERSKMYRARSEYDTAILFLIRRIWWWDLKIDITCKIKCLWVKKILCMHVHFDDRKKKYLNIMYLKCCFLKEVKSNFFLVLIWNNSYSILSEKCNVKQLYYYNCIWFVKTELYDRTTVVNITLVLVL